MPDLETILVFLIFAAVLVLIFAALVLAPLLVFAVAVLYARAKVGAVGGVAVALIGLLILYGYTLTPIPRMGIGALYFAVPPLRNPLITIDLALSRPAREKVVGLVTGRSLQGSDRYGGYVMPEESKGLSVYGTVDVIDSGCGERVFFMTVTGFSPDPYGGFEYVPPGCQPEVDPLGSGGGIARPLGDGWFWIEAS